MKKIILILLSVLIASAMKGQISNRFTYITTIGTGIPMNEPSSTPFTWQVSGHYKLTERFSAGIGTGLSFYEKALIPMTSKVVVDNNLITGQDPFSSKEMAKVVMRQLNKAQ